MKLENKALQELYDTVVNCTLTVSLCVDSTIDKAFRECDDTLKVLQDHNDILDKSNETLKVLQDRNDILERSNGILRGLNLDLCSKNRDLKNRIEQLEKDLDGLLSRAHCAEDEAEDLKNKCSASETNMNEFAKQVHVLKQDLDNLKNANGVLASTNAALAATITTMKENDKKHSEKVAVMRRSLERVVEERDDWRSRAHHEEEEKIEQAKRADILKSQRDLIRKALDEAKEKNRELKKDYETVMKERNDLSDKFRALKEDRDIWIRNNGEKQATIAELKKKVDDLTSQYQKISIDFGAYKHGQTDLWDMLQNVNDSQPNEFDVECESMYDVIGMDLEDFLDAYKKWQEQKEIDRMRGWLSDFCRGRLCKGCPLESEEYKCGGGLSFKRANPSDTRIIPDEDIKRYYEKALKCCKLFDSTTMEGTRKAISKACENFCKAMRDADIKITDNILRNAWEYTLTANVEVDRDLLEKVCGVKPGEEEHKLEYGDAVRVPWRDYDYMYIGPEGEHIRLFNPKTHDVVFVSRSEKLTYQGCKIVICDEEDLRKIWKDKK